MTIQTTSKILILSPELNALAVIAQSSHDLLLETEKTKKVYENHVRELQETISSQAVENQKLKAQVVSLQQMHAREVIGLKTETLAREAELLTILEPRQLEQICYAKVGSFTCCLSFDSFQAHIQADWRPYQGRTSYSNFLRYFYEQLKKATGPDAQAANDTLIEWFPLACSNLKTYEETRKGNYR
jgi:hypothetical protein